MRVIDLTHPIDGSLPTYFPWHPETRLEKTANFREHRCEVTRISIGTHTGTHVDAPSHVYEGFPTLDQYCSDLWYLDAQVLDLSPREPKQIIAVDEIRSKLKVTGIAVILKTGWDRYFGREDYYATYPPLSNEAAEFLVDMNIKALAADTPYTLDVHYIMLKKNIPLITNINNTAKLHEGMIKLITAPLHLKGSDGAPARVLALVEE